MLAEIEFKFGKHKGETFEHVCEQDKGYVSWVRGLPDVSGQLELFRDYIISCNAAERKKREAQERADAERRQEAERVAAEKWEEEIKRLRAANKEAQARKLLEEQRRREELERKKAEARTEFRTFLEKKFEEYRHGYTNLTSMDQLCTGYNPYVELIESSGVKLECFNSVRQEHWDPRKILEWGQTYNDKYLPKATPESIRVQVAVIESQLRQCCLLVKPNVKRKIYWELQNRYRAISNDITRVFGKIFTKLEKRADGKPASPTPPSDVYTSRAKEFFGERFTWSWDWPVATHVAIACKYYMSHRSKCEKSKESEEATTRRVLLIQMLLAFQEAEIVDAAVSGDGSEILYKVPNSSISILVEAPDQGAVHVFERPAKVSDKEHQQRIFALFRQLTV